MENDISYLSALRKTPLSNVIATEQWTQENFTPISTLVDELSNEINPRISAIADCVEEEIKRVDELSGAISSIAINDGTLTIQRNGSNVATFTANQAGNVSADIDVPTDLSDLTNSAGYVISSDIIGKYLPLSGGEVSVDFSLKIAGSNVLSGLNGNLAIGKASKATGNYSTALGNNAKALSSFSTALGYFAQATGSSSMALGCGAEAAGSYSIALGKYTVAAAENSIQIGNINNSYLSNNVADTLQIWDKPLLERTSGKIFIDRIPISLSTVEETYTIQLTEEQKTALLQESGMPAEAWGDFAVHVDSSGHYGYIGNVDCYSVSQNVNGDYVFTGGMPALNVLGWIENSTVIQGSIEHTVLSVGSTSADLALKSDLEGMMPLAGGGQITGGFSVIDAEGTDLFGVNNYGSVKIGYGATDASSSGIAIGYNASTNAGCAAVGYGAKAYYNGDAFGNNAVVSAYNAMQLGSGTNSSSNTLQFRDYSLVDANGDIPYGRLSANLSGVKGDYLPLSGGTLSGNLTLSGPASNPPAISIQGLSYGERPKFANFKTNSIVHNGSKTIGDYVLTFPDKTGTLAVTDDISSALSGYALTSQIPLSVSELINDSGYVTSNDLDLTKVMEYQGTVTTYADLPANPKKGAVYNVISAYNSNLPGTNYAWNGSDWDPLGGSIDVSVFATKEALDSLSTDLSNAIDGISSVVDSLSSALSSMIDSLSTDLSNAIDGLSDSFDDLSSEMAGCLSNVIIPKLDTISSLVSVEVERIDEISASLSASGISAIKLNGTDHFPSDRMIDLGNVITAHQSLADYALTSQLPTVNDGILTIQRNGLEITSFTANQANNISANIEVPLSTSQLINDSNFAITSQIPTVNNGTLTIQKNGTPITSFTADQAEDITADILVPLSTSELTNDSGFITSSETDSKIAEALTQYVDLSSAQTITGTKTVSNAAFIVSDSDSHSASISSTSITTENGTYKYPTLTGTNDIATNEVRQIYPISAFSSDSSTTIYLTKDIYVYRYTDVEGTGTFPTLVAPSDINSSTPCYFVFEIEWTTAAALASYSQTFDWINWPEIVQGSESHTYYIAGRYEVGAGTYTMNCWRTK